MAVCSRPGARCRCRVPAAGCRLPGAGCRVPGAGCRVPEKAIRKVDCQLTVRVSPSRITVLPASATIAGPWVTEPSVAENWLP
jgi:hypothetical protein